MRLIHAEKIKDGKIDHAVFMSLEEFIPYREEGWQATEEINKEADEIILAGVDHEK